MPINVLMTRTTDVYVGLGERAAYANKHKAALFISYHLNAATASAKGYEDFTYPTKNNATILMRDTYHSAVLPALRQLNQVNRGKKVANFAVLRLTDMPAVLVELGFITNAAEYDTIAGKANFELLAQTHATAIKKTLAQLGKPNGPVCLDAGHGGGDPGAVANGHTEAAYVLRFAKLVKEILEEKTKEPEAEMMEEVLKDMELNETTRKEIQNLNNYAVDKGIFSKKMTDDDLKNASDDDLKNKVLTYFLRKEQKNK